MIKKTDIDGIYKEIWDAKCKPSHASDIIFSGINYGGSNYYQNMTTGVRSHNLIDVIRYEGRNIYLNKTNGYLPTCNGIPADYLNGYFCEYNEKLDVAVVYETRFPVACPTGGEERNWEDGEAFLVFTKNGDCYKRSVYENRYIEGWFSSQFFVDAAEEQFPLDHAKATDIFSGGKLLKIKKHTIECLKKVYGNAFIGDEKCAMFGASGNNPILNYNMIPQFCNIKMEYQEERLALGESFMSKQVDPITKEQKEKMLSIYKTRKSYGIAIDLKTLQTQNTSFGFVQRLEEGLCVIRIFGTAIYIQKPINDIKDICLEDLEMEEFARIFVKGFERPVIMKRYFDRWYMEKTYNHDCHCILFPWEPEVTEGTSLQYYCKYVKEAFSGYSEKTSGFKEKYFDFVDYDKTFRLQNECFSMGSNIIEALNSPYGNDIFSSPFENSKSLIFTVMTSESDTMSAVISHMFHISYSAFDTYAWNKSVVKDSGFPKHMLITLDELYGRALEDINSLNKSEYSDYMNDKNYILNCSTYIIKYITEYFSYCPEYLQNMNRDQFKELVNTLYDCMMHCYNTYNIELKVSYDDERDEIIERLIKLKGPKQAIKIIKYVFLDLSEMIDKEQRENDFSYLYAYSALALFNDYLNMITYLEETDSRVEHPQYKFSSSEEIKRAHDSVVTVYNLISDEREHKEKQQKFEKLWNAERYEKYQYAGDVFSVVAPKDVLEIANEGSVLHHCVKSYISNVVEDKTNILFIRRNGELSKPFYTLEIQENKVRQCHGFGNCNIDKEEGLENFLRTYCKKKNFIFEDPNKVLAAGRN